METGQGASGFFYGVHDADAGSARSAIGFEDGRKSKLLDEGGQLRGVRDICGVGNAKAFFFGKVHEGGPVVDYGIELRGSERTFDQRTDGCAARPQAPQAPRTLLREVQAVQVPGG